MKQEAPTSSEAKWWVVHRDDKHNKQNVTGSLVSAIIIAVIQLGSIKIFTTDLTKNTVRTVTWMRLVMFCVNIIIAFPLLKMRVEKMETNETKIIKEVLLASCFGTNPKLAKEYGTSEVTIGFQRGGNGREIVDFMSFDAKNNTFRCYEIKVSMEDFRSKAKKSWYGNYNYLVVSSRLFSQLAISDWRKEIPDHVGLIVINPITKEKKTAIRAKKQDIGENQISMLKTSLIRTLFYQKTTKGVKDAF